MIPLPSPPTDNLYKFLAIAGLLLLGIGVVTPYLIEQQAVEARNRRITETENRIRELAFKTYELAQRDQLTGEARVRDKQEIEASLTELSQADQSNLKEEIAEQNRLNGVMVNRFLIVAVIGGILTAVGFWFWWRKVQRLQDELLGLELARARVDSPREPVPAQVGKNRRRK